MPLLHVSSFFYFYSFAVRRRGSWGTVTYKFPEPCLWFRLQTTLQLHTFVIRVQVLPPDKEDFMPDPFHKTAVLLVRWVGSYKDLIGKHIDQYTYEPVRFTFIETEH